MVYKRYPLGRKYTYNVNPPTVNNELNNAEIIVEKRIPLPNEREEPAPVVRDRPCEARPSFISKILSRIGPEELILIGILILLLIEEINDDFLILILLYILFT